MILRLSPQHLIAASGRRWRRILFAVLLLWALIYTRRKRLFSSRLHTIFPSAVPIPSSHVPLPFPNATALCAAHSWRPYAHRASRRKVYDLIMINNELDWLEIRLETMSAYVDYFVVLESKVTFTGLAKPLALQQKENWARIQKWESQIIYRVVEGMPENPKRTWDLEDFQRNAMLLQGVLGEKTEEKRVREGDVLIVADVDEIVRPDALVVLKECDVPRRVTLRSQFYYYGFQFLHQGEQWAHPQATIYTGTSTILPADLRNGEGGNRLLAWWEKADLWNAGWHCSTCFQTVGEVLNKMASFSHTGLNAEVYREQRRIVERVRSGKDLWDREGEMYDTVGDNQDIPEFLKLKENAKRFGYLLDREGPNGGFTDFVTGEIPP